MSKVLYKKKKTNLIFENVYGQKKRKYIFNLYLNYIFSIFTYNYLGQNKFVVIYKIIIYCYSNTNTIIWLFC